MDTSPRSATPWSALTSIPPSSTTAKADFPDATWLVGDLALLDLPAQGIAEPFEDFFADLITAGLALDLALSTWELHPFTEGSDFLVAIARRSR